MTSSIIMHCIQYKFIKYDINKIFFYSCLEQPIHDAFRLIHIAFFLYYVIVNAK